MPKPDRMAELLKILSDDELAKVADLFDRPPGGKGKTKDGKKRKSNSDYMAEMKATFER